MKKNLVIIALMIFSSQIFGQNANQANRQLGREENLKIKEWQEIRLHNCRKNCVEANRKNEKSE